jgi:Cytochrome oxidase complex assembly protein 1
LTLVLVGVLAFVGIFVFVIGVIKKTDVYADALKAADQSSEVQAALGSPVEAGWMPQGKVNMENGGGEADFTIPLSGPKGKGTLVVKASKTAGGAWVYSVLEVQTADGTKLDLRKP